MSVELEKAITDVVCPVADKIRANRCRIQGSSCILSELLEFIEI